MRAISATVTPAAPQALVRMDNYATAVLGGQIVALGGASYTLNHSCDDPCDLVSPVPLNSMFWDSSLLPLALQGIVTVSGSFKIMACPLWFQLNLQAAVGAPTTWNPSDKTANCTLSGGNLIVGSAAGGTNSARAVVGQATGKYYWEATYNTVGGINDGVGMRTPTFNFASGSFGTTSTPGQCGLIAFGSIYLDGIPVVSGFGSIASGTVVCVAIDLINRLIWFRVGAAGNWNASGTANPATGVGGVSIAANQGSGPLFPSVSLTSTTSQTTANFGGSAFTGAVPSGFTAGFRSGGSGYVGSVRATFLQVGEHSHSNITQGPFAPHGAVDDGVPEGSNFRAMGK